MYIKKVTPTSGMLEEIEGSVQGHRDGHGFLIRDDGEADIYLPPNEMRAVLHKDRVKVRVVRFDRKGRPEGRVVEILERPEQPIIGRLLQEGGLWLVAPEDKRYGQDVLIPKGATGNAKPGQVVVVELTEPPALYGQPVGRVKEVLGEIDDPGMEIEIAVRKYSVPHEFSTACLEQAKGLPDIRLATPEFTAVHEVEAVNQLLVPLGVEDALGPLQVFPDSSVVAALSARLPTATKRIALHISAREPERRWGNDNFILLVNHILQTQLDTQILLFWSPGKADDPHHPGDDDAAEQLIKAVGSDRLIPMPTQNLTELIAALSLCDLFIGTDGGALHLAVALNKKVLAMFENKPDKLNHWYPWQVANQVVHSLHAALPDISQISQTQVERALKELVAQ